MSESDTELARVLLDQGLVTPTQLQECLRELAKADPPPRLIDLLRNKGYLTGSQDVTLATTRPTVPASEGDVPQGERFGKFVKTAKLGEGGMGEVWKAWDCDLRRCVALKFLKTEDPAEIARFRRESQTAARLNHPNIAAIYEATEQYIAMQFVDGQTLATHPRTDRKRLVALIRDAALAVHAAHELGVVHRDLKPQNLMVDSKGRLYVLDFGIAKATVDGTVTASVVGTPAYMPPEQAKGRAVDPRSDVYSLGATLYELFTDRAPFRGGVYEILKMVVDEEPKAPRSIDARIDPEIETIILKCLEKDPARRYASARELAEDLARWLAGEAIRAHPPSTLYRLRKTIVRNRAVVAVAAVAVLALGAFLVRAGMQRAEARRWTREAETLAGRGQWAEAKKLLDQARPRITVDADLYRRCEEKLAEERSAAESKRREDDIFGPIYAKLREFPDTAMGWKRMLEILDAGLAKDPTSWNAWLVKAGIHEKLGEVDGACEAYERAYGLNLKLAAAHYRRGRLLMDNRGDIDEALVEFERAERADPSYESAPLGRARAAIVRKNYPEAKRILDEVEKSTRQTRELFFLRGSLYGNRDSPFHEPLRALDEYEKTIEFEPTLVQAWNNRAGILALLQRFEEAIRHYDRAIEIQPRYANAWAGRGDVRRRIGELAAARKDLEEAIRCNPKLSSAYCARGTLNYVEKKYPDALADFDRALRLQPRYGRAWNNRGYVHKATGRLLEAIEDFSRAIEIDPRDLDSIGNRGYLRCESGDLDGAIVDLTEAIQLDPKDPTLYSNRGRAFQLKDRFDEAIRDLDEAIRLKPDLPEALFNRGCAWSKKKEYPRAIADFEAAVALRPDYAEPWYNIGLLNRAHPDRAIEAYTKAIEHRFPGPFAHLNRGKMYMMKLDFESALRDYDRAAEIDPKEAEIYINRGYAKRNLGRKEEAIRDFEKTLELLPPDSPHRKTVQKAIDQMKK